MAAGGFVYTKDIERRIRLQALLIDDGTALLRKIFEAEVLKVNPLGLEDLLLKKKGQLKSFYEDQKKKMFSSATEAADSSEDFDISLLYELLRKLCNMKAPTSWGKPPKPPVGDTSREAWIMRLYLFRNKNYGHIAKTALSEQEFDKIWEELSEILIGLGGNQSNIQERKVKPISPEQAKMYLERFEELERFEQLYQQGNEIKALVTAQSEEVSTISENLQRQTIEGKEIKEELSNKLEDLKEGQQTIITGQQQANSAGEQKQSVEMKTSGKELYVKYTWTAPGQQQVLGNIPELEQPKLGQKYTEKEESQGGKMPPIIQKLCKHLQDRYRGELARIRPLPWCEDFYLKLEDMFTTLEMVCRDGLKEDSSVTVAVEDMFQLHNDNNPPKTIRVEGNPGIGKTTLCYKIVYDWSAEKSKFESDNKFSSFQLVLYVEMRKVPHDATDIKSTIFKQVFPLDHHKHEAEFWEYVRSNPENVLFVLDGLDEMPEETRQHFDIRGFIRGKIIPGVHVIVTSRPYLCSQQLTSCDRHFVIKGYSQENIKSYINRHKKLDTGSKHGMLKQLNKNESLHQLTKNPLNLALLCILWQEDWNDATLPQTLTDLYSLLVWAIVKRYASNCLGISKLSGTSLEEIEEPQIRGILQDLNHLAWKGIQEGRLAFPEDDVGCLKDNIVEIGFLTKDLNVANPFQSYWFQFLHKTFQEYFAAWYLHGLCVTTFAEGNTLYHSVASYFGALNTHPSKQVHLLKECVEENDRYRQVLKFLAGFLGTKADCLFKAFHDCLSKSQLEDENIVSLCLECLHECGAGAELVRYVSDVLPGDWCVGASFRIPVQPAGEPEVLSHLYTVTTVAQTDERDSTCLLSCNTYSDQMLREYNTNYIRSNEALYGLVYLLRYQAKRNTEEDNLQLSSVELRHGLDNSTFLKAITDTKVICFLHLELTKCDNEFIKETCNLFKSNAYKDLTCKVSMSPSCYSSLDNLNKVLSSVPAETKLTLYSSVYLNGRNNPTNKHTFSRVFDTLVRLGSVTREREASIKLSIDCAAETSEYETEFATSFLQNLVTTLKECQSLHQQGSLELLVIVRNLPMIEKPPLQSLLGDQVSSCIQDSNNCILSKMTFECSCEDDSVVSTMPLLQSLAMNQSLNEVSILCDDPESIAKCLCEVFAKNRTLQKLEIGFLHPVDDETMANIFSSYPTGNPCQLTSFSVAMETGSKFDSSNSKMQTTRSYQKTVRAILYKYKNLCDGSALQKISFISGPGNTMMKTGATLNSIFRIIPVCPGSLLKPFVEAILDSQLVVNLAGMTWVDVTDLQVTHQERTNYYKSDNFRMSRLGEADTGVTITDLFLDKTKVTDTENRSLQVTPQLLSLYDSHLYNKTMQDN